MPRLLAALTLKSIYKELYTTHTSSQQSGKAALAASSAGLWKTRKTLLLKMEAEEKGFQVIGIVSKKARKWTVWVFCVEYEARKMQGRIMSKMGKNQVFHSPAINYLFGANNYFLMFMLFTYWASTDLELQSKLCSPSLSTFSCLWRKCHRSFRSVFSSR